MDEETFGNAQAAAFLRTCNDTVYNLARKRKIVGRKIGKGWVFLKSNLLSFIRAEQNEGRQDVQVSSEKREAVCRST